MLDNLVYIFHTDNGTIIVQPAGHLNPQKTKEAVAGAVLQSACVRGCARVCARARVCAHAHAHARVCVCVCLV